VGEAVFRVVKIRLSQSPGVMVPVGLVLLVEVAGEVPLSYWNSTVLLPRMRAEMNEKPALKPVEVGDKKPICSGLSPAPSPATAVTYSERVWTWPSDRFTCDGVYTAVVSMATLPLDCTPPPAAGPGWSCTPSAAPPARLACLGPPLVE